MAFYHGKIASYAQIKFVHPRRKGALGCLEILGLMGVVWFFLADGDLFGLCTWCTPVFVFVFRFYVPRVILWFVEPEFLSDKSFSPYN